MKDGGWRIKDGEWKIEDGEQNIEDEDGGWKTVSRQKPGRKQRGNPAKKLVTGKVTGEPRSLEAARSRPPRRDAGEEETSRENNEREKLAK